MDLQKQFWAFFSYVNSPEDGLVAQLTPENYEKALDALEAYAKAIGINTDIEMPKE